MLDEALRAWPAAARMAGVSLRTALAGGIERTIVVAANLRGSHQDRRARAGAPQRMICAGSIQPPGCRGLRGKLFRLVMLPACRRSEVGELRCAEVHHLDDPTLADVGCRRRAP